MMTWLVITWLVTCGDVTRDHVTCDNLSRFCRARDIWVPFSPKIDGQVVSGDVRVKLELTDKKDPTKDPAWRSVTWNLYWIKSWHGSRRHVASALKVRSQYRLYTWTFWYITFWYITQHLEREISYSWLWPWLWLWLWPWLWPWTWPYCRRRSQIQHVCFAGMYVRRSFSAKSVMIIQTFWV